jgi:hypothetical protein
MKKNIEYILVTLLLIIGILKYNNQNFILLISLLITSSILSILYLFYFDHYYKKEINILLNIITRWILSLFPISFVLMFVNAEIGRIIEFTFLFSGIILIIIRYKRESIGKSEIIRMYIMLIILSITGQSF